MNLRRFLSALFLLVPACAQAQHVVCTAITSDMPAPNPAIALYWAGNSKEAAARFAELLAAKPGDPELTEGAVRANIDIGDVATAAAQADAALSAHPDSSAANAAHGEVLFRQGRMTDADKAFAKATHFDPCYAPAHWGVARLAEITSMYASGEKQIKVAHALNQRDPDISLMWIETLPLAQQAAEFKSLLPTLRTNSEAAMSLRGRIAWLEAHEHNQGHHCELVSSADATKVPLVPILWDMTHEQTLGLDTTINGHTARLTLDSGASGLVIGRAFANQAGLKMEEQESLGGFGDHGPQKSHVAYADSIKIGGLEFHDCRVDVSDRREVVNWSGLIGTDVFRRYLVSVNYPDRMLELSPLPTLPGANAQAQEKSLDTESGQQGGEKSGEANATPVYHDRYISPEMKDFTPAYRFGHMLLVPTIVNNVPEGLMVLDTGDGTLSLSEEAAKKVTHAHVDNVDSFHGMSGHVEKLSAGGVVTLKFGQASVSVADVAVMDHSRMSQEIGAEISGFIGYPALHALDFQIDYRDGLVNFGYDRKKDPNRAKAPGTECSYCNPGEVKHY